MARPRKYVGQEEFDEAQEEARNSRARIHKRLDSMEKMIHDGMHAYMTNGGGELLAKIFKESLNDIGIHNDEAKDLREDFKFLRESRQRAGKTKDVIWRTVIAHGVNTLITAATIGLAYYLMSQGQ